jgi:two-component system sensor histidine kinase VicK
LTILPDDSTEGIVVLDGMENTVKVIQQFYSKVNNESNLVTDANGPQAIVEVKEYRAVLESLIKRGVKRRLLTEITPENLPYCKQLVSVLELRHLEGLKGNFAVSETEYMASAILYKTEPIAQIIYSNAKAIVDQHKYLFNTLWNRAVPGEQRIKEIEQGIEPEFVEVINDGKKVAELILESARGVKKEALLILPQPKTMRWLEKPGVWSYLIDSANRGANIRVVTPLADENSELVEQITANAPDIEILAGPPSSLCLFIQDTDRYLIVEDKDPDAAEAPDAISVAIYSNSRNGVLSFKSFFETLWKQSQLYEELKATKEKIEAQDRVQREFLDIAAHELRTPIQPILGMANLIEALFAEGKKVSMTKEDIALIIRNAKRLEHLSADILEVARIESGNLHLNTEQFNMRDLIMTAVKDVKDQNEINEHDKLRIDCESGDIFIDGDRDKILQVVSNFLANAAKFTRGCHLDTPSKERG